MFVVTHSLGKILALSFALLLATSCAGRSPKPVAEYQEGDTLLSCKKIRIEQASIDAEVARLLHDADKTGKNVALGAGGLVSFGIAWFWMDFSDAEKVEIAAYRKRYLALEELAASKACPREPWNDRSGEGNPSGNESKD